MQFSFKRPQTSKSVSAFYRDRQITSSLPKESNIAYPSQGQNSKDKNQKWRQAAQKINRQMVIHRALHVNSEPFRMLSKMGGQVYNSQPKITQPETPLNKTRIRISSKQKKIRDNSKQMKKQSMEQQIKILQAPTGQSKLKRKRRNENFRVGGSLQQELKTTDIFYESPIVKMGYNMQFEAYLRLQHISQIRPDHGGSICRNSIIFFLKDAPFSANIISQKNTDVPIALSLFPQFFDSKLSVSNIKRQQYFEKMLNWMNSTYDPERMAAMPRYSDYPIFDQAKYDQVLLTLITHNEQNYKGQWAQNIVKRLKYKLNQNQLRSALAQQWQFFNRANGIITLDYALKNPQMSKKLKIAPFLPTRVITARRILYHGGYCKTLYSSWSSYVDNSKKRLAGRIKKYTNITQSIFGWYCNFQNIQLCETDFYDLLQQSLSVELFNKIQQVKIHYSAGILQELWFRGVLCLLHYNKFLMTKQGEYQQIGNYTTQLSNYIREARNRTHQMKSAQQIEVFYLNFYQNFLNSLRKSCHIRSLQELLPALQSQNPQLNNIKVLLHIQLSRTVEISFQSLRQQIIYYKRPLLRLHLIIDRQCFKFLQQEEDIINAFANTIKNILGIKIEGYALATKFKKDPQEHLLMSKTAGSNFSQQLREKLSTIRQYPQIYQTGQRNSLQQQKQLKISYKTEFIFDEQIRQIINTIRIYYKECFVVLAQYQMYLPFIKLTTTQKIFGEEQGSVEQSFLKNLRVVSRYKESINSLQKLVKVNIFEVDCSAPIKALQERIKQIQYIIQQNYLNIIHQKIESVDSELNTLKISAHNIGLTAIDIEQTQEKIINIRHSLKMLQSKTNKIAQMVLFCVDNRRKVQTVITCFCQLVSKKQDLHRDIENLLTILESKRPEVEAQSQQQAQKLLISIEESLTKGSQVETTCFEFVNMPQYITSLQNLVESFIELNANICKHLQNSKTKPKTIQQRIAVFRRQSNRFQLIIQYWKQFYTFQTYFKEISKTQTRTIDFIQFSKQTKTSEQVIEQMQKTQQEWWQKDKIGWKPIIHRMHQYYSKKFKSDVQVCSQLKQLIQILTNRKIRERHWQVYGLEGYKNITFRELIRVDASKQQQKLKKMDQDVNFQYQIYLAYEQIQKKIKSHHLIIIDLNDSDVLDLQNLNKCIQFLRNIQIDIQQLMQKDVGDYYDGQLKQLLTLAQTTVIRIQQWKSIEQKYIRFIKFHMVNDQFEHNLFSSLIQLHRKLIKSYDIDNSIVFISKNIVMNSYLLQIQEQIKQIQVKVLRYLALLRAQYPRLFLLTDEQLFDFMSHNANIQKYLKKCFPQILNFGIRDGSIQKIGERRELIFAQPLYIQQMIGRVNNWVLNLQELIKFRLKEFFKTNQIITEGRSTIELQINFYEKYPTQLAILDQQIIFTEQLSQAVSTSALSPILQQIQSRIEFLVKQKRQNFKLLLFLTFRQRICSLMREQDLDSHSFQWLKYPRFYRKNQLEIRVAFINQENIYGFSYLQKSEIIYTDNVFMGNCLIGPSGSGKTAFAKYLSYLCGQQLLLYDPRSIDHSQESINSLINYFRVNAFVGNWLLLQRIDLLGISQLKLIAECLSSVQESLKQQSNKLMLSGQTTSFNKNSRILMSLSSLSSKDLPGRLCVIIRPVWMIAPNQRFLLQLYLQSKGVNNTQVGKILKFCSWLQSHRQISLQILNWIKDQEDPSLFSSSLFFQKAYDYGLFQNEGESLLLALKDQELKMSHSSNHSIIQPNLRDQILLHNKMVLFGQKSCGKTTDVIGNLAEGKYLIINAYNYTNDEDLFSLIGAISNLQGFSHIVFKHGLQYYPLMKESLSKFKIIFIQNNLHHLQLGVVFDLRMLNHRLLSSKQNEHLLQQIIHKIFQSSFTQIQNSFTKGSLFLKCIDKLSQILGESIDKNQLYFNFSKILKIMISQEYQTNVAFIFSIIWSFGFEIDQKKVQQVLRQVFISEDQNTKNKFQKISINQVQLLKSNASIRKNEEGLGHLVKEIFTNKLIHLTELVPLKKGKFSASLDSIGIAGIKEISLIADNKVTMKNNFMYNVSLIRNYFASTMVIQGSDWITTILKASNPLECQLRTYNFGNKTQGEVFSDIFKGSKCNGVFYSFSKSINVVIDDVHLCSPSTINSLKNLSEYNFAMFLQQSKLKIYQTSKCQFTFGFKCAYNIFTKALRISVQERTISTIFNQYIQSYCEKSLQVDRSIFSLLNLASNISRSYKEETEKYFWFKNPLLLLQQAKVANLTELIQFYVDYLNQILPQEKENLKSQRALLQIPRNSVDQESQIINTTNKYIKFRSRTQLIQQLVADNEILQQIQGNHIQSIFFERFIKNYFTKDILNYVIKVHKYLQFHHLILLDNNYAHTHKILRYACKISNRPLMFINSKNAPFNAVFMIDLSHCKDKDIEQLQNIIKLKNKEFQLGSDFRFVMTGNLHSPKLKVFYQKFPFLKSHFLNIVLQQKHQEESQSKQSASTKSLGSPSNDFLQKFEQLAQQNQFNDQLRQQFLRVLDKYRKEEFINLQFYRKIGSEMMINIDRINTNLINIPKIMKNFADKETQLYSNQNKNSVTLGQLNQKLQKWQSKRSVFTDLFNFKHEKQIELLNKLRLNCNPLFSKMDKIYKRIESIEPVQFARLKNNLKNNENTALVHPLHSILSYLNEKGDSNSKEKINQFTTNILSNPLNLASALRNIHHREIYDKEFIQDQSYTNRLISTGMNGTKLKYFLSRADQINENTKKFQKVSPIYKPISNWIAYFHSICASLKDYLDQHDEADTHLISQLIKFNEKSGQNIDINYQKQNLHVFITESQNKIKEIYEAMQQINKYNRIAEIQHKKIVRLKRFFNQRQERLQKVSKLLIKCQYMKKISSGVSLYFKNIDNLSFYKTLIKTTFNEYLSGRLLDPELLLGIFSSKLDLFKYREKLDAQNIGFEQLEIIHNLVQRKDKPLKLVEDRNNLIKHKLIDAAEARGFLVHIFQHMNYSSILKSIDIKLSENTRLVIIHENIHYLQAARKDNDWLFDDFIEEVINLVHSKNAEIIYVTNCLPKINPQLRSSLQFGRIVITRQRFMTDVSNIFNVALQKDFNEPTQKDTSEQKQAKKRRGDFQTVVKQRNTIMKGLMSSIQDLSRLLLGSNSVFEEHSLQEIQNQKTYSERLQNNLINLIALQQQHENLQKQVTNYTYLSQPIRQLIQQQLQPYLFLYEFTDDFNNKTNNQFFSNKQFYRQWINLLKNLREQRLVWFNQHQYRTLISEIVVKNQAQEKQKEEVVEGKEEETVKINQAINPIFHKYNCDVFIYLVQKILKGTNWLQKSFLYQYTLGACIIQAFQSNRQTQAINRILQMKISNKQQINQECIKILKMFDEDQFYRGYQIRFDKLIIQFFEALAGRSEAITVGTQITVFVYYFLMSKLNQYDPRIEEFLVKFYQTSQLNKSHMDHRYQFIKSLRNIRLMSEYMLKLTQPLSLSINLDTRGDRQKLITIIQQEKYLLYDLVELLKMKSLSKKRELEVILINMTKKQEVIQTLKHHYRSSKQWILLANFSIQNRLQVRQMLEEILCQLGRMPPNLFFRVFIVLKKQEQGEDSLYYNKYEINRVKGCHNLTDMDYYQSINKIAIQDLFEGGKARQLIEQLISTAIKDQDDYTIAQTRLQDLKSIFSKLTRKYKMFMEEDYKLHYKNLVEELVKLGFLKKQHNQRNFYQYIANYFISIPNINCDYVQKEVEDERQLLKEGISDNLLIQDGVEGTSLGQNSFIIERINILKIQQYFKNINSEFAEMLRKEIQINNQIQADYQFLTTLGKNKSMRKSTYIQANRVCLIKYGIANTTQSIHWVDQAARKRLPLFRFINNLKLKEICNNKKVDIQTSGEFWIFLTAFQYRQVKEFAKTLTLDRSELESRYSNGIGLFGNFTNLKDYATRMKIVLVDVQNYNEVAINEQQITRILKENNRVEGSFILAIRKANPQKIIELNVEQTEIQKIFAKFNVVLQIGGQLTLQLSFK